MSRFLDERDSTLGIPQRGSVRDARVFMELCRVADVQRKLADEAHQRAFAFGGLVDHVILPSHRLLIATLSDAALLEVYGEMEDGNRGWEAVGEDFDFDGYEAFVHGGNKSLMFAGIEIGNDNRGNSRAPGEVYVYTAPEYSFRAPLSQCTSIIPSTQGRWETLRDL